MTTMTDPVAVSVSKGIAISAESTSTSADDHVADFKLTLSAGKKGGQNAALNVVSTNSAFSSCEITGQETGHGTLKISHRNPGPAAASDANAAALSIDLQANGFPGTAAQGIFLKSTSGGTTGKIINYVDPAGQTLFALLPDGSLLLPPVAVLPAGSDAGLKLCNFGGILGVVDSSGNFTALT